MDFRSPPQHGTRRRSAPPDYFARSVQFRLLMVTSSLMLVIIMMFEARKPETWEWMWAGSSRQPAAPQQDTRLQGGQLVNSEPAEVSPAAVTRSEPTPAERVRLHAWKQILDALTREERLALDAVLHSARTGRRPEDRVLKTWQTTLPKIESAWGEYIQEARSALEPGGRLTPAEVNSWQDTLDQVDREWSRTLGPSLAELREASTVVTPELRELHALLNQVSLQEVEDDTVPLPAEQFAWFRLLADLHVASPAEVEAASVGQVSFLQLFRQPDAYRGQVVSIRGTARRAYRVSAPSNAFGITHYFVFWVQPGGEQLAPYIVYSLELPAGFPAVPEKGALGDTSLTEPVEFTGYFFKRQAYRARDGVRTSPVLLAKVPGWSPPERNEIASLPSFSFLAIAISVAGGLAAVLAWLAYRGPLRPLRRRTELSSAEQIPVVEPTNIGAALTRLAQTEDESS